MPLFTQYAYCRIYPALTDTFSSSLAAFSYLDAVPTFSATDKVLAKYLGATAMVLAGGKIKKKYGITDVNVSLTEAVTVWSTDVLQQGEVQFEGGTSPSVADVAVYGVVKGLESVPEQRFHSDIFLKNDVFRAWYERMNGIVGDIQ